MYYLLSRSPYLLLHLVTEDTSCFLLELVFLDFVNFVSACPLKNFKHKVRGKI